MPAGWHALMGIYTCWHRSRHMPVLLCADEKHRFLLLFSSCWGFLKASIDLVSRCVLVSPGFLLLRAMPAISEPDEAKLDPYWVFVIQLSHNGNFQWHTAFRYTEAILASHRAWSKELPNKGWMVQLINTSGSHLEVGFNVSPFAFWQVV